MKKSILTFGLISGLITSCMLISILVCYNRGDFSGNMVLGFSMMILAFSFVFVGIKNHRDKVNHGTIAFGEAFKIGSLIALIAATIYVVAWLIIYYGFIPDFMEKYTSYVINDAKASGKTTTELTELTSSMQTQKNWYKNPILVVLLTYMEILPIGLIVALISALILKRKNATPVVQ